ncbi:hypothetical protein HDU67_006393 [Dinochytrium kinnereticum]|nr:hypothetical protein HDU67_006393 [Dinochytrium kinnereticum]
MVRVFTPIGAMILIVAGLLGVDARPSLGRRQSAVTFSPHPFVPPPGSPPIRMKSYSYNPSDKTFSGEVWVQNLAFNKIVSVFWSTPTIQWAGTNGLNASYVSTDDNGYEVWRFSGAPNTIGVGSQFYLRYQVAGQTFWDSNGGPAFNYALEDPSLTIEAPKAGAMNSCVGNGIQRKLYTSGARYLVVEALSDNVVHFEVSEKRRPNPNLKIFNTAMVDEENLAKRFCGPTAFTDGGNVLETPTVRVTIDAATLSVTVFDKVKNTVLTTYSYSNLAAGEVNNFSNPTNMVLQWTREQTENVYGIAASPKYGNNAPLTSEGDWNGKAISPPNPFQGGTEGYGNTMVGVQEGAMVYAQLPVVYNLGSNGYQHAFFLDDQHRLDWDLTTANQKVTSRGTRALRWFAIAGSSLNDLRKTYLKITGPMSVPPKSAFGLQVSKYGYKSWGEANFEIDGIVSRGFPLDAVIFDLYWFGGRGGGFGRLAWDGARFPDPTGNLKTIRSKGPGSILIEEPYVDFATPTYNFLKNNGGLARLPNGAPADLLRQWWGSGSYVDHTSEGGITWATCKRCKLIAGCKVPASCPANLESTAASNYIYGHWQDLGEPEIFVPNALYAGITEDDGFVLNNHRSVANIYQFLKTKRTWEQYKNQTLFRRPVSLTRTVAPGIQRYGALTWSGDIPAFAPAVATSFGVKKDYIMAGIEMHSSDIGGFHRKGCNNGCDINRLYTVWYANSAWFDLPIRAHVNADDEYARSFTASPAAIGDVASNLFNTQIRYFLMPLYYSLAHQANRDGETLITPIFLRYPNDKLIRSSGNQFMIGPIMVAYTVDTNTAGRGVYLPAGTEWYNFHTHDRVVGTGAYSADISYTPFGGSTFTLPALVQAGSIFPTAYVDDKTKNSNFQERRDNTLVNPLQVRVYPGAKSTFTATEDDGESQSTAYSTTDLTQELSGNTATVTIAAAKGYYPGQMTRRQLIVEVVIPAAFRGVASVTVDGKALALNTLSTTLNAVEGYKTYGNNNRVLAIYGSVASVFAPRTVVVTFN